MLMFGYWRWKASSTSGSRLEAKDGIAATISLPRCLPNSSRRSPKALSQSRSRRCASGRKASPSGDSAIERVVRTNSVPPTACSRLRIAMLSAGCDRCSRPQACAKLRVCATTTKAFSCLMLAFICNNHESLERINWLNISACGTILNADRPGKRKEQWKWQVSTRW